ncbi:MAG: phosphodiester glycosidase family protein [Candidatus Margulisiibacteriota bacterium]
MKKILSAALILFFLSASLGAAVLNGLRHSSDSEKIRLVLDLDSTAVFRHSLSDTGITLEIDDSVAAEGLSEYRILDALLGPISMTGSNRTLKITIPTHYRVEGRVFALSQPDRIVVDINRTEISQAPASEQSPKARKTPFELPSWFGKAQEISEGLYYLPIDQDIKGKAVRSHAVLASLTKLDLTPAIVVPQIKGKDTVPVFSPLFDFFGRLFGEEKEERYVHFTRRTVNTFVKSLGGLAGVNGTFFGAGGTPLGVLIIDGQLVSSPLFNRTALIVSKDGSARIAPVKMEGYLKLENGQTLGFSALNQPVGQNQIVVQTPYYQMTDPSGATTNIVVEDDRVVDITYGETKVPGRGFVVCANGAAGEAIRPLFKKGDTVKWFFITSPPFDNIKHVIGGGPRLVQKGYVNVTSIEENFRRDVASGRAARTAVGITKSGDIILAMVEKNQASIGATLEELASLMVKLGAYEAMNFDGGGSSALSISGKSMNSGSPRAVSNAIVVIPK